MESVDLYPTLVSLCGLPAPTGPQTRDGIDLTDALKDTNLRLRDHAFHAFPHEKLDVPFAQSVIGWSNGKGIQEPDDQAAYELYDYQLDPHEIANHAASQPEVVKAASRDPRSIPARSPSSSTSSYCEPIE